MVGVMIIYYCSVITDYLSKFVLFQAIKPVEKLKRCDGSHDVLVILKNLQKLDVRITRYQFLCM